MISSPNSTTMTKTGVDHMMEKTPRSEVHVRIHDINGFVCGIDINEPIETVVSHIMKLRSAKHCHNCGCEIIGKAKDPTHRLCDLCWDYVVAEAEENGEH